MTTRLKTYLAAGLAAVTLAGAAPAVAKAAAGKLEAAEQDQPQARQGRRGPGHGMRGPMGGGAFGPEFRFLDLTEEQRAQLRKIREARQAEFKDAGDKLRTARQGMRALIEADSINESAIRAKSTEVAAAEAEMAILNARVRAESLQVLTPEQQQKLKEMRTARQNQVKQRRGARRQ